MRGRKPNVPNVIPFRGDGAARSEAAIRVMVKKLQPKWFDDETKREWRRVATILAQPSLERLKPHYVDVIAEYCRLCVRLRLLYAAFENIDAEYYDKDGGRYGDQRKTDPRVAQRNETWRQWNSLRMSLGLDPASERNLLPGQGDLFSDPAAKYLDGR